MEFVPKFQATEMKIFENGKKFNDFKSHSKMFCLNEQYLVKMWSQLVRNVSSRASNYVTPIIRKKTTFSIELLIALNNIDNPFGLKIWKLPDFKKFIRQKNVSCSTKLLPKFVGKIYTAEIKNPVTNPG